MMTERPGLGSPLGPRPPLAPPRAHPGPPRPPIGPRSSLGPRPPHTNGSSMARSPGGPGPRPPGAQGPPARPPGFGSDDSDKSLKMKIKRTKSGRQEIVAVGEGERSDGEGSRDSSCSPVRRPPSPAATSPSIPTAPDLTNGVRAAAGRRGRVDAGTSTDAATLTEPEALGPCEPGTAVSLEGIVWHETDAGTHPHPISPHFPYFLFPLFFLHFLLFLLLLLILPILNVFILSTFLIIFLFIFLILLSPPSPRWPNSTPA